MTLIAVDVGGTNIRLGLAADPTAPLTDTRKMACRDFPDMRAAIESYLGAVGAPPDIDAFSIAVAGPVLAHTDAVDITNSHWQFDKSALLASLPAKRLLVINDFIAQAMAQTDPLIAANNVPLLHGKGDATAPLLVIGPGTGLGIAALVPLPGGDTDPPAYITLGGEGGHSSFTPRNDRERAFDAELRARLGCGHITAEHALSGAGLESLYRFLAPADAAGLPADTIGDTALAAPGPAREAMFMLLEILATTMADAVLTLGCWRGAVICGGIVPRFIGLVEQSGFAARFRDADAMTGVMAGIPVAIAADPHTGIAGAKAALASPDLQKRILVK